MYLREPYVSLSCARLKKYFFDNFQAFFIVFVEIHNKSRLVFNASSSFWKTNQLTIGGNEKQLRLRKYDGADSITLNRFNEVLYKLRYYSINHIKVHLLMQRKGNYSTALPVLFNMNKR